MALHLEARSETAYKPNNREITGLTPVTVLPKDKSQRPFNIFIFTLSDEVGEFWRSALNSINSPGDVVRGIFFPGRSQVVMGIVHEHRELYNAHMGLHPSNHVNDDRAIPFEISLRKKRRKLRIGKLKDKKYKRAIDQFEKHVIKNSGTRIPIERTKSVRF